MAENDAAAALKAKLLGTKVATTRDALGNTNISDSQRRAEEAERFSVLDKLRNSDVSISPVLPKEPKSGEVVYMSTLRYQQFHLPSSRTVVMNNTFYTTDDAEEIEHLNGICKLTNTLHKYEGPWAVNGKSEEKTDI